ncbi:FimD/PapC C-terminal domain-containing protein [Rahnella victoriana]|uniref:FimD/PapC C-terminal domain-containing protein n=1 Tax=Rahnella victoriana TaxID=1510570 RepID=UPI00398A2CE7
MANIRLQDGSAPPFGARIYNHKDRETGIVTDDGSVYLSGINAGEKMKVIWDEKAQCEISLPKVNAEMLMSSLLLPCFPLTENVAEATSLASLPKN